MDGVLIEEKTANRVFAATRKVEGKNISEVPVERRRRRQQQNIAGDSIRLAEVLASIDTWTYTVDIYLNPDGDPVEENVTAKANTNQLADGETIPTGSLLEVRQQPHGIDNDYYWTFICIPRSL